MAEKAEADTGDANPVPLRKLVMTLLAISFGTILECESCTVNLQKLSVLLGHACRLSTPSVHAPKLRLS
jgi:hypothetical protein